MGELGDEAVDVFDAIGGAEGIFQHRHQSQPTLTVRLTRFLRAANLPIAGSFLLPIRGFLPGTSRINKYR